MKTQSQASKALPGVDLSRYQAERSAAHASSRLASGRRAKTPLPWEIAVPGRFMLGKWKERGVEYGGRRAHPHPAANTFVRSAHVRLHMSGPPHVHFALVKASAICRARLTSSLCR